MYVAIEMIVKFAPYHDELGTLLFQNLSDSLNPKYMFRLVIYQMPTANFPLLYNNAHRHAHMHLIRISPKTCLAKIIIIFNLMLIKLSPIYYRLLKRF